MAKGGLYTVSAPDLRPLCPNVVQKKPLRPMISRGIPVLPDDGGKLKTRGAKTPQAKSRFHTGPSVIPNTTGARASRHLPQVARAAGPTQRWDSRRIGQWQPPGPPFSFGSASKQTKRRGLGAGAGKNRPDWDRGSCQKHSEASSTKRLTGRRGFRSRRRSGASSKLATPPLTAAARNS